MKMNNLVIPILLCTIVSWSESTNHSKCVVNIKGYTVEKNVGDVWISTQDRCLKFGCEIGLDGLAVETMFREYCENNCGKEYDLTVDADRCCGKCVEKRCFFENTTYNIGDIWKSESECQLNECLLIGSSGRGFEAKVVSFKKSCPKINCHPNRVAYQDCCPYCKTQQFEDEISDAPLMKETYLMHPCRRGCVDGVAKTCRYLFRIESYETLSKACYECPNNETDCYRPHCIAGDGFRRSIVTVNRMIPGPIIDVCKGDTIVVDVENHLLGDSTTIHWHGLHQRNTPHFDGVPQITQCPILPHTTFRYIFKASNAGTHWYHSHTSIQRGDGAFGALIVREPFNTIPLQIRRTFENEPEHIIFMQDWVHQGAEATFNSFHHSIGDNKPKNILINGRGRYNDSNTPFGEVTDTPYEVFDVQNGSLYRFRIINAGFLNCPLELSIDNHSLLVIATDGHFIEPIMVDSLVSYAGERFDLIVNANQGVSNFWVRVIGLMDCDERFGKAYQGAILHYIGAQRSLPDGTLSYDFKVPGLQMNSLNKGPGHVDSVAIIETTSLEPDTVELLSKHTDYQFYINYDFYNKDFPKYNHPKLYSIHSVSNESNKFFGPQLNHISMRLPSLPLLLGREWNDEYSFCNESVLQNNNCQTSFCECTHVLQVPLNSSVEVILIDEGYKYDANHPFHLHGHEFRVVAMERIQPTGVTVDKIKQLDQSNRIKRKLSGAPIKDTVTVPDGGFTIIRFIANNPGMWLFHCHIDFHSEVGMALVFKVGDYHQMAALPSNFPNCSNYLPKLPIENTKSVGLNHMISPFVCFAVIMINVCELLIVFY